MTNTIGSLQRKTLDKSPHSALNWTRCKFHTGKRGRMPVKLSKSTPVGNFVYAARNSSSESARYFWARLVAELTRAQSEAERDAPEEPKPEPEPEQEPEAKVTPLKGKSRRSRVRKNLETEPTESS